MKWGNSVDVHMLHIKVYGTINLLPLIFWWILFLPASLPNCFSKLLFFVCLSKKDRRIMSYDYTVNNMKLVAFAISYWASIQNFLMFLSSWSFFCQISGLFLLLLILLVMKIDEMFVEQSVNEGLIGCVFKTWKEHAKNSIVFILGQKVNFLENAKFW